MSWKIPLKSIKIIKMNDLGTPIVVYVMENPMERMI